MSQVYLVNLDHKIEGSDAEITQLAVLHAPTVNEATLTALLLIALWDKYNCFKTHSGGNGLSKKDNYLEFVKSFESTSYNTLEVKHLDLTIEVPKIRALEPELVQTVISSLEKMNVDEFLSDNARFCALGRLYDFLTFNEVTSEMFEGVNIYNPLISEAVKFLVAKIEDGKPEYSTDWVYSFQADLGEAWA